MNATTSKPSLRSRCNVFPLAVTSVREVTTVAERFLASAVGALHLFGGTAGSAFVKGVSWNDDAGRAESYLFNAATVVPSSRQAETWKAELIERTEQGITVGANGSAKCSRSLQPRSSIGGTCTF